MGYFALGNRLRRAFLGPDCFSYVNGQFPREIRERKSGLRSLESGHLGLQSWADPPMALEQGQMGVYSRTFARLPGTRRSLLKLVQVKLRSYIIGPRVRPSKPAICRWAGFQPGLLRKYLVGRMAPRWRAVRSPPAWRGPSNRYSPAWRDGRRLHASVERPVDACTPAWRNARQRGEKPASVGAVRSVHASVEGPIDACSPAVQNGGEGLWMGTSVEWAGGCTPAWRNGGGGPRQRAKAGEGLWMG